MRDAAREAGFKRLHTGPVAWHGLRRCLLWREVVSEQGDLVEHDLTLQPTAPEATSISTAALGEPTTPAEAKKRFFTVLATEPKGGTTVEKEVFPTAPLPQGGGYILSQPDEKTRRWEVSAYVWQPAQLVVNEGDEVTIEFVGINGAEHPTTIEGFGQTFAVKRGQAHRVTFVADKVGSFGIVCSTHRPSMSGELVVLPKQH